jgi:NADPH:quinone reductase-like Zn-dependent oxidoreductase
VVIDYTAGTWEAGIPPVDLVFDTAGGERLLRSPAVLRDGGRLVSIVEEPPQASGITSVFFVVEPNREQLVETARRLEDAWPAPAIDSTFPLAEAADAFERSMAAGKRGKVVLDLAR